MGLKGEGDSFIIVYYLELENKLILSLYVFRTGFEEVSSGYGIIGAVEDACIEFFLNVAHGFFHGCYIGQGCLHLPEEGLCLSYCCLYVLVESLLLHLQVYLQVLSCELGILDVGPDVPVVEYRDTEADAYGWIDIVPELFEKGICASVRSKGGRAVECAVAG